MQLLLFLVLLSIPVVFAHELEANTTFEIATSGPTSCPEKVDDNYVNSVVILTFLNLMSWIISTFLCTILYFKYIRKRSVSESSLSSAERGNVNIQESHLNLECPFVWQGNENICGLQDESKSSKTLVKMRDEPSEMDTNIPSKSNIHCINGNCKLTYIKVDQLLSQGNELGLPLVTTFIQQEETINRFENLTPRAYFEDTENLPENETSTLTKVKNYTEILQYQLPTIDEESEPQFEKNFEDSSFSSSTQTVVEIENEKES